MLEPFSLILSGRSLSPTQRQQVELLDQLWLSEMEDFFDRLQLRSGARVLVYNCGLGLELPRLARRVAPSGEVVGVQPDPFLAHEARLSLREYRGQGIRVVLGDPVNDPIPDGQYEVIFLAWRMNEIQPAPSSLARIRATLTELRPRLSPQGRLAIWEEGPLGMQLYPPLPLLERTLRRLSRRNPPPEPLGRQLAGQFAYINLMLESARPLQKVEVPGSPTGRWFESWLQHQGPDWVEAELLSRKQWERLQKQWESRRVNPGTLYFSPHAFGLVARALTSYVA